jgi:Na+-transporting methylmalonyl-CoA/oxaloacetate decarboxylase gamma subunit
MSPILWLRVIGAVVVFVVLAGLVRLIYVAGQSSIQSEWDTERAAQGQALAAAQARVRDLESSLATTAATIRRETNEELTTLASQRDSLANRVRLAEARARVPSSPAGATDVPAGPVDPQPLVLGSLGTADVDEAYRADTIRLELMACYAQYERVEAALNGVAK